MELDKAIATPEVVILRDHAGAEITFAMAPLTIKQTSDYIAWLRARYVADCRRIVEGLPEPDRTELLSRAMKEANRFTAFRYELTEAGVEEMWLRMVQAGTASDAPTREAFADLLLVAGNVGSIAKAVRRLRGLPDEDSGPEKKTETPAPTTETPA